MKLNNLAVALMIGIASYANSASAVELDANGMGQVLIYPYYTVNAHNQTLVSVVNTQNVGKVAKVRFREGYDGRDVTSFNLYLSPFDVWVATVFDTAGVNGRPTDGSAEAGLLTPDNSCTDPALKTGTPNETEKLPDGRNFTAFLNFAYAGTESDGGPGGLARTRSGHIELIEMATVTGATLADITHVNGVPANCPGIIAATGGSDYGSPSGGLFGTGSIVNASTGTLYGYNADAINGFYTNTGNIFGSSATASPDLTFGDNSNVANGKAVSYVFSSNGALITSSWPLTSGGSVDAISSLFTADQVFNEYEIDPTFGGVASEWVITFPTKSYYADPTLLAPTQPFTKLFGSDSEVPGTACETVTFNEYDREERESPPLDNGEGRPVPPSPTLCWEAQILSFQPKALVGAASQILGSPIFTNVDTLKDIGPYGTSGMLDIVLSGNGHLLRASSEGNVFSGLPVTGFLAKDFTNKNVTPGVLGNYSGLFHHHNLQTCANPEGTCTSKLPKVSF